MLVNASEIALMFSASGNPFKVSLMFVRLSDIPSVFVPSSPMLVAIADVPALAVVAESESLLILSVESSNCVFISLNLSVVSDNTIGAVPSYPDNSLRLERNSSLPSLSWDTTPR